MNRSSCALAVFAVAALAIACSHKDNSGQGGFGTPRVTVMTVTTQAVELPFDAPARLQGSRQVEVRARVRGILEEWLYEEGQPVREGQPMFRIDPAPYAAAVDQARGAVGEAEATATRTERDVKRLAPLVPTNAVSQREYDDAVSARDLASAALDRARANLRSAELELNYTRVAAPVSGISGRALQSQGALVDPNGNSLLTTIARIDPIWALFTLPAPDLARLQRELARAGRRISDLDAELVLADGSSFPRHGRINFAGSTVDPTTGSVELRAEIENPDGILLPGQFVRILLHGAERSDAILIPQKAVLQGPQGRFVYVVAADSTATVRPLELGNWVGDQWLVDSGLAAGEHVIVDGIVKVRPGGKVDPSEGATAAADSGRAQ
ncbi:MAG TPA: efflux RND transporter periplasmic adaptor subunit [Candidatus Krumholzibacteria bacterium]|nr:efflux RND transporter periplasmic adaptor subunit [Candidatus Krumholzibacteria bacterium]